MAFTVMQPDNKNQVNTKYPEIPSFIFLPAYYS
jgi:hypothetical protein